MTLRLSIENMDRLPDGGPLRIQVKNRGLDLGRDQHLDWTLPDPSRHISGKHCEIRFRDGGYWLHDVSTNGTFVNGAQFRLNEPYLLRHGDRLSIGPYIIAVEVEGQAGAPASASPAATQSEVVFDPWSVGEAAAAPDEPPAPAPTPRRPAARAAASAATAPPAPPQPRPQPAEPAFAADADLLLRIARAAGIDARAFAWREPGAVADEIGAVLRLVAHHLAQMLASRSETKGLIRSANRTMIRPHENNPLKFTASPEEALSIMFGPPTRNYLDAQAAVERSFADLKAHQMQTFGAMQAVLEALFEDLAPEKIDRSVEPDRGIGGLVGSRKARL